MTAALIDLAYLAAATLFVLALKGLSHPRKAVRGNLLGSLGMLIAVAVTLLDRRIVRFDIIAAGVLLGTSFGLALATKIRMTAMPQLVALFNGLGGGASALVAGSALLAAETPQLLLTSSSVVSGLVGAVTFSGSFVAMAKLQGWLRARGAPRLWQRGLLVILLVAAALSAAHLVREPTEFIGYGALASAALLIGLVLVLPIGGADMPVIIALLNACSGLAAAATGFVLMNQALVISGSLVGASGFILTRIMCRAMNRTLIDVMFSGLGAGTTETEAEPSKPAKSVSAEEVAMLLEASRRVIIVPGYGMAVAQAQHATAELARNLQAHGVRVDYAIHPVAGRMPGHMNVLLAEADVPYEELYDLEAINPELVEADVVLVIGANDVVNPRARTDRDCSIYGMPVLNVDRARTVVVLKRSMAPGFAGVSNPLFSAENTMMLFGDAKQSVVAIVRALQY